MDHFSHFWVQSRGVLHIHGAVGPPLPSCSELIRCPRREPSLLSCAPAPGNHPSVLCLCAFASSGGRDPVHAAFCVQCPPLSIPCPSSPTRWRLSASVLLKGRVICPCAATPPAACLSPVDGHLDHLFLPAATAGAAGTRVCESLFGFLLSFVSGACPEGDWPIPCWLCVF